MDNFPVKRERGAVPDWAKSGGHNHGHTPDGEPTASQRQLDFIRDLLGKKDLKSLTAEQIESLMLQPSEFWQQDTTRLSKKKASRIIDKLIPLPLKPREEQSGEPTDLMAERFAVGVPPGRYAVDADSGELRFYNVWVSRDKKRLNVYVCHGPDESDLKFQNTTLGVLHKIKAAGIREAAIRFGLEIGECSNCGRRLTNRISRALGIGPVCGGRMFGGDEWRDEVKAKRAEMLEMGIDPDEELE
jgi:hypothetical protein